MIILKFLQYASILQNYKYKYHFRSILAHHPRSVSKVSGRGERLMRNENRVSPIRNPDLHSVIREGRNTPFRKHFEKLEVHF